MMLQQQDLHEYQNYTVQHIIRHDFSMLWLGLGLGKTISSLTAYNILKMIGETNGALVVAPLRVCQLTWMQEARKWDHTQHLTFSNMTGSAKKRQNALFTSTNNDIYLVNYESLVWLATQLESYFINKGLPLPFDTLIWDEVSKVKRSVSKRFEAFAPIIPHFKRRIGLTASPCSNGMQDLWGQFFNVDGGLRLGTDFKTFQRRFFYEKNKGQYSKFEPYDDTFDMIVNRIQDITVEMKASDHLDMPELSVIDVEVELPPKKRKMYETLEKEFFIELDNGKEVEVFNKAALSNRLLQYCIAEDTEVLTKSGWKYIQNISVEDELWDGVEWVKHTGVVNNGVKNILKCFGVWMTPDHEVLTDHGWKQAQEVLHVSSSNRFNRSKVQLPNGYRSSWNLKKWSSDLVMSMRLWEKGDSSKSKFEIKNKKNKIMWLSSWGSNCKREKISRYDRFSSMGFMGEYAISMQQSKRQRLSKLWGSWDKSLRRMEQIFREVLGGYGRYLSTSPNIRACGQYGRLSQGELSLGYSEKASKQSKKQCIYSNTIGKNDIGTSIQKVQNKISNTSQKIKSRLEGKGLVDRTIKEGKVYDITNCGKRNRFTVKGDDGEALIVHNCNGIIYNYPNYPELDPQEKEHIHDEKYDALQELMDESGDEPILLAYSFQCEKEEILRRYPKAECLTGVKEAQAIDIMERFNKGQIKLLIAHPLSAGHGLNLQESCSIIVWFGLNYNLELYEQFVGRINRQGQKSHVRCFRILCRDTMDYAVREALIHKDESQSAMRNAIGAYRKGEL